MNWMRVSLRKLAWKTWVLGAAAGLWAAFTVESVLMGLGLLGLDPGLRFATAGLALGLTCGALIAPIGESLHQHPKRRWIVGLWGGLLGALIGVAGIGAVSWWLAPEVAPQRLVFGYRAFTVWVACLPFLLGLLGAAIGFGSGLGVRNHALGMRRLKYGLIGGLIAGTLVATIEALAPGNLWLRTIALAAWAAVLAQVLFWTEKRRARHWLRVLTGPGEDEFFPLMNQTVRVGKAEQNEIPLLHYAEVYPVHCRIDWVDGQYRIVDDETGGTVYVNFRQVQEQPLKPGDLIKIGSALLQYGEAS
jgi:hypothetical protein